MKKSFSALAWTWGAGASGAQALLIFGTRKTSEFSINAQSSFASIILDGGVLGTSLHNVALAHLTTSLYFCSSESNTLGESRALKGVVSAQKNLKVS